MIRTWGSMDYLPFGGAVQKTAMRLAMINQEECAMRGATNPDAYPGHSQWVRTYIGKCGEAFLYHRHPWLQPLQFTGPVNYNGPDFAYNGCTIEAKCNLFPRIYALYFVNVHDYKKINPPPDFLACTIIDNIPNKALRVGCLGLMEFAKIKEYEIVKDYDAPAYGVKVEDILKKPVESIR